MSDMPSRVSTPAYVRFPGANAIVPAAPVLTSTVAAITAADAAMITVPRSFLMNPPECALSFSLRRQSRSDLVEVAIGHGSYDLEGRRLRHVTVERIDVAQVLVERDGRVLVVHTVGHAHTN